jgi:Phasin protein
MVQRSIQESLMVTTEYTRSLVTKGRDVAEQARAYLDSSMSYARQSTENLAGFIESLETPVKTLADAGTRLAALSQRFAERMVTVNAKVVGNVLAESAGRLRTAAKANDLKSLVRGQMKRVPASRERLAHEWRDAAQATTDAGRELKALAGNTYKQLRKPARGPATTKAKRARTAAKSAARKPATKRRAATRKTTARSRKAA